jgi:hypothetical protein
MTRNDLTRIEASVEAEIDWRRRVFKLSAGGLWSKARTPYLGSNIPGKVVEPLNWAGGLRSYNKLCLEKAERGYEGLLFRRRRRRSAL